MFSNILCAVDFSPSSEQAVRAAAGLAHALRAKLALIHAWHLPPVTYAGIVAPQAPDEQWLAELSALLADAAADARRDGAPEVSTHVATGEPASEIAVAAVNGKHDLIAIGSHGRTGLSRFLLGSVAERVMRQASCSVLVARPSPSGEAAFRHALVAVDFSAAADTVVRHALDLVAGGGALTLVHAVEPIDLYDRVGRAEMLAAFEQEAVDRLAVTARRIRSEGDIAVRTRVVQGAAARVVLAAVEADPTIDVVAVGSHGMQGMRRLLVGSVAEKIVRHSPVSVLVAR